jgi:hypothetical protein
MLPPGYISRVPLPEGAVEDPGLQFPWQTPSRWTYPGANSSDGNGNSNGARKFDRELPEPADQECLMRTHIQWHPKKGTKTYLKV